MVKDKKKTKLRKWLAIILFLIIGFLLGIFAANYILKDLEADPGLGRIIPRYLWLIACMYFAILFQIIIHESGHLLFGKLSGYRFVSFRVGSFMIISEKGKYRVKKFSISGTGGQCLMMPPQIEGDLYPYFLYNLGGPLINLVFALLCLLLNLLLQDNSWLSMFLVTQAATGIVFALLNGIPLKLSGIANDGYNAMSLGKDSQARQAFWIQLNINGLIADGKRLRDLPEEWFVFSKELDLSNPFNCNVGVLRCAYLHDKQEFFEAKKLAEYIINHAQGTLELQKNELRCELLFYEIIGMCRKEVIDELYTKELEKYIKASAPLSVSRKRLLYAYELLVRRNMVGADKQLKDFKKVATTYPFAGEIESEWELIELIQQKAAKID